MKSRVLGLGCVWLAVGCGAPDPVLCNEAPACPIVDEDATDEDVRVAWATGQKLLLTLEGGPAEVEVVGGEAVFTPDSSDPDCEANCAITLKRLRVRLESLFFVSSQDSLKVSGLEFAVKAPITLENPAGAGSVLPVGTETRTCATVQGLRYTRESALEADALLVARATSEELTLNARVPMDIDGSTALGCRPFDLELSGALHGATPFEQNPLAPPPE